MTDNSNFADNSRGRRSRTLQGSAYTLRQHAIKSGGDLEGWRLARRMRDAASWRELTTVERDLGQYLQTHRVDLPNVA